MFILYDRINRYFAAHPNLNAIAHAAGGFGLAVVLQPYIQGTFFMAMWYGWALIALSAAIHLYPLVMKK